MNAILSAIERAALIKKQGERGDILFSFEPAFILKLEKAVADYLTQITGHPVSPFTGKDPRQGIRNNDLFNPKVPEELKREFSRRLITSVEERAAVLKGVRRSDRISYKVGINFCVGCGAWNDGALFSLEWMRETRS
jgi:hypothetical protein